MNNKTTRQLKNESREENKLTLKRAITNNTFEELSVSDKNMEKLIPEKNLNL